MFYCKFIKILKKLIQYTNFNDLYSICLNKRKITYKHGSFEVLLKKL